MATLGVAGILTPKYIAEIAVQPVALRSRRPKDGRSAGLGRYPYSVVSSPWPRAAARPRLASVLIPACAYLRHKPAKVSILPGEPSLHAILEETWPLQPVELSRINDQSGVNAATAQRLIHLLGVKQGHVKILVPRHAHWRPTFALKRLKKR